MSGTTEDADPDAAVRSILESMLKLLRSVDEKFWSSKIDNVLKRQSIDFYTIQGWFGGMGSLNDLMLCAENNHVFHGIDVTRANEQLRKLCTELWTLTRE